MVKQTEIKNSHFLIEGDCIDEIVRYCLQRIRSRSQRYYKDEIKRDLLKQGFSWIDFHAGISNYYDIKLIK